MLIRLKTDFMRYEPCDLSLTDDHLLLRGKDWQKSLPVSALSAISLIKDKHETQRLEPDIGDVHIKAIIPRESVRALADLLEDIALRKGRVDLRMDS